MPYDYFFPLNSFLIGVFFFLMRKSQPVDDDDDATCSLHQQRIRRILPVPVFQTTNEVDHREYPVVA